MTTSPSETTQLKFWHVFIAAMVFCFVVILQSAFILEGAVVFNTNRVLIFILTYLLWATFVPLVNRFVIPDNGANQPAFGPKS